MAGNLTIEELIEDLESAHQHCLDLMGEQIALLARLSEITKHDKLYSTTQVEIDRLRRKRAKVEISCRELSQMYRKELLDD